jgi:hypothetical protein
MKEEIEKQLNEYFSIIDLNIIKLNAQLFSTAFGTDNPIPYSLKDEIIINCDQKVRSIKQLLQEYFKGIPDKDFFILPFRSICTSIIEQPINILKAIELYPDSTNIDLRYKYINDQVQFAIDKFNLFNESLKGVFNLNLADGNKKPLINIFIFTEQFINELRDHNPAGIKYIDSPLFKIFFESIISYKSLYVSVFGEFHYPNINEVEAYLKDEPNDKSPKTFKVEYTSPQLNKIRENLINEKIIDNISENDFIYLFTGQPIFNGMKSIKWKKSPPLGHEFLKGVVYHNEQFNYKHVNECIIYPKGHILDSNDKSRSQYRNIEILKRILNV